MPRSVTIAPLSIHELDDDEEEMRVGPVVVSLDKEESRSSVEPFYHLLDGEDDDPDHRVIYDLTILSDDDDDDGVEFISSNAHLTDGVLAEQIVANQAAKRKSRRKKEAFTDWEPKTRASDDGLTFIQGYPIHVTEFLLPGDTVEMKLVNGSPFDYGDFLKIRAIYEDDTTGAVYLRGILYRRSRSLRGKLPKKANEVYQVLHHNLQDDRDIETQSLHDVPVTSVAKRRCLRHTNKPFPEHSFRTDEDVAAMFFEVYPENDFHNPQEMQRMLCQFALEWSRLTCRWKRILTYSNDADMQTGHADESSLQRLLGDECDEGCVELDAVLRKANMNVESDISAIDLDAEDAHDQDNVNLAEEIARIRRQSPGSENVGTLENSYADFFCGGGGVTAGARMAGFLLKYGVDFDADACRTMRINFPGADIFCESVFENLVNRKQANAVVRCCHISTVCKTLSSAYTVRGKNHDANEATLFCVGDILRKARPMVATLEQTFSALNKSKQQIFNAFVWQFTALGYSVRWARQTLHEYGVPQCRKRLIMIASCPGHPLPEYPSPTHGPGLQPYTTVADALNPIQADTPNHHPGELKEKHEEMYDDHQLLKNCITTSGGVFNWHPTGKRAFTEREYASLQTFPLDHEFYGRRASVIRQVGNAVPPRYAKLLYESVRKTFLEVDRLDVAYDARAKAIRDHGSSEDKPITLDDDEDDIMDTRGHDLGNPIVLN